MCPVNIRKFIPSLDEDVMFNYAPTIAMGLDRRSEGSFWAMAKRFKQAMSIKVDRLNAFEHLMAAEHLHGCVGKLTSLLQKSRGSYDFAFSNVGRLEMAQNYTTYKLDSLLGVTVALPWRNCTTLVTTYFRGQIDVAFVSNDDFLPYPEAVAIKNRATEILTRAIDLDGSIGSRPSISD
jgi:hypothetical protein